MPRRQAPLHKPPLLGYYVMASRAAAPATPWYLEGGVSAANCIAAYKPIGAADLATSYVNIANSGTYDCSVVSGKSAPAFNAATGWTGGDNVVLTTGIVPSGTGWTVIIRFNGEDTGTTQTILCGARKTGYALVIAPRRSTSGDDHYYVYGDGTLITGERLSGEHVVAMADEECYLDGVSDGTVTFSTANGENDLEFYLLSSNENGSANSTEFIGTMQAAAIYNTTLTGDQVAAITTAMNALTSESRTESLEGMLSFEPEEEKLWWQGADVVAQAQPQVELTWWDKAKAKVKVFLGELKQAIMDYINEKA